MPKCLGVFLAVFVGLEMISCGGGSVGKSGEGPPPAKPEVVYVSSATVATGEILAFNVTASGVISSPKAFQAPGYIFDLKADATSGFLYAADFGGGNIAAYAINRSTGALTTINGSPFSSPLQFGNAGPLAVSTNGKFVFSSDASGNIVTFTKGPDGTLAPGTSVQDSNQPLQLVVDPLSKFLFAANMADPSGNEISGYFIDPNSGSLTPIAGSPFTFLSNSGPFGITITPSGKMLYTVLTNDSSVAALTISTTGALSQISGSPFKEPLAPSSVVIDPAGRFLYVSNQQLGSISVFSIDSSTGALTEIPGSPVIGGDPGRLAMDPQGRFLFAVYPSFDMLAAYKILAKGGLAKPSMVPAGGAPVSITVVQLP
jgi:6-phosphogluconolactonase (cycloisomerase 2 family)